MMKRVMIGLGLVLALACSTVPPQEDRSQFVAIS